MSAFQAKWYLAEVEAEMTALGCLHTYEISNNFYIKSRQRSNLVAPEGIVGAEGLRKLTPAICRQRLDVYSCKYARMMKKIKRGNLCFIYCAFTGIGGIESVAKVLDAYGYLDFAKAGPGRKRYAIFSGDETLAQKGIIRDVFNASNNDDSSQLQIIIGSPAIKEGVSLLRLAQIHIIDPYWNQSRIEQIFRRGGRFCSHKSLDKKDRKMMVYIYMAVVNAYKNADYSTPKNSIDAYMLAIADEKKDKCAPYEDMLKQVAVDRYLYGIM
jgi:hypothetical protein